MARLATFDPLKLAGKLNKYIATARPFPILARFIVTQDISKKYLYELARDCPELLYAIEKCHQAKEAMLEEGASQGELNASMCIFSLKQLGWKDRSEQEISGGLNVTQYRMPETLPPGAPCSL